MCQDVCSHKQEEKKGRQYKILTRVSSGSLLSQKHPSSVGCDCKWLMLATVFQTIYLYYGAGLMC